MLTDDDNTQQSLTPPQEEIPSFIPTLDFLSGASNLWSDQKLNTNQPESAAQTHSTLGTVSVSERLRAQDREIQALKLQRACDKHSIDTLNQSVLNLQAELSELKKALQEQRIIQADHRQIQANPLPIQAIAQRPSVSLSNRFLSGEYYKADAAEVKTYLNLMAIDDFVVSTDFDQKKKQAKEKAARAVLKRFAKESFAYTWVAFGLSDPNGNIFDYDDNGIRKKCNRIKSSIPVESTDNPIASLINFCKHQLHFDVDFPSFERKDGKHVVMVVFPQYNTRTIDPRVQAVMQQDTRIEIVFNELGTDIPHDSNIQSSFSTTLNPLPWSSVNSGAILFQHQYSISMQPTGFSALGIGQSGTLIDTLSDPFPSVPPVAPPRYF